MGRLMKLDEILSNEILVYSAQDMGSANWKIAR